MPQEETREVSRVKEMFQAYKSKGLEGIKEVLRKRDEEYHQEVMERAEQKD